MSDPDPQSRADTPPEPRYETDEHADKRFRGWRLIGVILAVVVVLALISFVIDWVVIGPLEGRAF
jgi:anti-sigma-K factor RskA